LQYRYGAPRRFSKRSNGLNDRAMGLCVSVAEVEPDHVQAGVNHLGEHLRAL